MNMKKAKRIILAVSAICLLLSGLVFSLVTGAEDYTGVLSEYTALLDAVDAAEGAVEKTEALAAADKYFAENPIDPASDGYGAAVDRAAALKASVDALKMTELNSLYTEYGALTELSLRRAKMIEIYALIEGAAMDESLDGFSTLKGSVDTAFVSLKTDEINYYIGKVNENEADRGAALGELFDFAIENGFTDGDYTAAGKLAEASLLEIEYVKHILDTTVKLTEIDTKTNVIAINKLRALAEKLSLDEALTEYSDFKAAFDGALAAHEAQKNANREELAKEAWFLHYGEKAQFDYDFQDDNLPTLVTKGFERSYIRVQNGKDTQNPDNKYLTVYHDKLDSYDAAGNLGKGNHIYTSDSFTAKNKGLVIEIDVTTFGEWANNGTYANIKCTGTTVGGETFNSSNGKYLALWAIDGKGNLGASRERLAGGEVFMSNVIVPGQWLHITCVFNPDKPADERLALYIDYELVATFDPNPDVKVFEPFEIRVGQQNVEGEFSIDNFNFTWGGSVRNDEWFASLTDEEKFIYISDYLYKEGHSISSVLLAKEQGDVLVGQYGTDSDGDGVNEYFTEDAALRLAVDKFLAFDSESLVEAAMEKNLLEYIEAVEAASALGRSVDNIEDRQKVVNAVTALDNGFGSYLNRQDERYISYLTIINTISSDVEDDIIIRDFTNYMTRFSAAATTISLEKHYNSATSEYNRFTAGVRAMIGAGGYEAFTEAYNAYTEAGEILAEAKRAENSKKIIVCVDFIKEYKDEAAWVENAEYINKYIVIIRDTLKMDYDADYEGLSEALAIYEPINAYFYGILQKQHVEIISAELAKFETANSYIEKMGICAYITRYVSKNDIDENNEEIKALLATHRAYLLELSAQEGDYLEVLEENTVYFVDVVGRMSLALNYNDIKALQAEAEIYYFTMNAGSVIASEAIEIYEEYTAMLDSFGVALDMFVGYVDELKLQTSLDSVYYSLVDCSAQLSVVNSIIDAYHLNGVWESVAGADAAKTAYENSYSNYMKGVVNANSDIDEASEVAFSVRTGPHNETVVAILFKLIFG